MYTAADIEKIKNILIKHVPSVQCIFLFGSYASGKAKEDSDLDFAILTNEEIVRKQKLSLLNTLWNEVGDAGYTVDFIIKKFSDFENEKKLPTISRVIQNSGKLLWEKN